jgi:hypothetical protein
MNWNEARTNSLDRRKFGQDVIIVNLHPVPGAPALNCTYFEVIDRIPHLQRCKEIGQKEAFDELIKEYQNA